MEFVASMLILTHFAENRRDFSEMRKPQRTRFSSAVKFKCKIQMTDSVERENESKPQFQDRIMKLGGKTNECHICNVTFEMNEVFGL